jgi:hypothetical protein
VCGKLLLCTNQTPKEEGFLPSFHARESRQDKQKGTILQYCGTALFD